MNNFLGFGLNPETRFRGLGLIITMNKPEKIELVGQRLAFAYADLFNQNEYLYRTQDGTFMQVMSFIPDENLIINTVEGLNYLHKNRVLRLCSDNISNLNQRFDLWQGKISKRDFKRFAEFLEYNKYSL